MSLYLVLMVVLCCKSYHAVFTSEGAAVLRSSRSHRFGDELALLSGVLLGHSRHMGLVWVDDEEAQGVYTSARSWDGFTNVPNIAKLCMPGAVAFWSWMRSLQTEAREKPSVGG